LKERFKRIKGYVKAAYGEKSEQYDLIKGLKV
jgi:hypothetical protein